MAIKYQIVQGPGFFDLIFSLTSGEKIRFTFNSQGTSGLSGVFEGQLQTWGVIGDYEDREIDISGRISLIKGIGCLGFKTANLNFRGSYNARTRRGEMTISAPDED